MRRNSLLVLLIAFASLPQQNHALSSTSPSKKTTSKASSSSSENETSCRIFIGGLSEGCTTSLLQETFQPFGTILDVSIVGINDNFKKNKRKPFAFVTFDSPNSAKDAISNHQRTMADVKDVKDVGKDGSRSKEQLLFRQVKMEHSRNQKDKDRSRSNAAQQKEQEYRSSILAMCHSTNLILLVQTTHVDRLSNYLNVNVNLNQNFDTKTLPKDESELTFKVEGLNHAARRNMSLLFLSSSNPTELANRLHLDPILSRALKKCYVVNKIPLEVEMSHQEGNEKVIYSTLSLSMDRDRDRDRDSDIHRMGMQSETGSKKEQVSYRLNAFPPSIQSNLLTAIHKINIDTPDKDTSSSQQTITLNPRTFTDVLSVVQVYTYKGKGNLQKEGKENDVVMSGISPSFAPIHSSTNKEEEDSAVNRAYFKLQEAMSRYYQDFNDTNKSIFHDSIALDCGAAPGGWSKFLADDMKCKMVYSVDPGNMTIDLPNVNHLQMKIQDAIPIIKERDAKIKIFVSDMYLHNMEAQLDFLLLAREEGILEDESFFVLTLKVTGGYSKAYFDRQAKKVMDALHAKAEVGIKTRDTVTYHLFSNRNGERTIMGYIMS